MSNTSVLEKIITDGAGPSYICSDRVALTICHKLDYIQCVYKCLDLRTHFFCVCILFVMKDLGFIRNEANAI